MPSLDRIHERRTDACGIVLHLELDEEAVGVLRRDELAHARLCTARAPSLYYPLTLASTLMRLHVCCGSWRGAKRRARTQCVHARCVGTVCAPH